ncbi:MAG: glycosyltransferase [Reinekea sp.]
MAAKIPVIATRCGGPEEILRDGVDGVLVPARNSHELAEAIFRALENNNISEMVSNAYERVTADFSLNALLIKYQRLAESILDHSHQKI